MGISGFFQVFKLLSHIYYKTKRSHAFSADSAYFLNIEGSCYREIIFRTYQ